MVRTGSISVEQVASRAVAEELGAPGWGPESLAALLRIRRKPHLVYTYAVHAIRVVEKWSRVETTAGSWLEFSSTERIGLGVQRCPATRAGETPEKIFSHLQ
jgi:hypothetical protein